MLYCVGWLLTLGEYLSENSLYFCLEVEVEVRIAWDCESQVIDTLSREIRDPNLRKMPASIDTDSTGGHVMKVVGLYFAI